MSDLITPSRAAQNPVLAQLASTGPAYLASLITAASDAIRRACGRDFTLSSYTEYHDGGSRAGAPLRLRQFPVTEITRLAANPRPALRVVNVDAVSNQRATVETTATGIRLLRMASAVATTTDLPYVTYPTVASLAAAINALGAGWSALSVNGFNLWPAGDFKPLQGAAPVLTYGHELELYTETISPTAACVFAADETTDIAPCGWRLDEQTGELYAHFPRASLNIRIDYTAGFSTIPQPIQEACVQLAQDLYQAGLVNNTLKKATLGSASVELKSESTTPTMSSKVRLLISPYMDYSRIVAR